MSGDSRVGVERVKVGWSGQKWVEIGKSGCESVGVGVK